MSEAIKIHKIPTIEDSPLPAEEAFVNFQSSSPTKKETHGVPSIKEQGVPVKRYAIELMSSALNTRKRRILAQFQFASSGALQIGKYANGVTGDIRISPTGFVSRDSSGNTTVSIDAESGDAVFKGTLQAGTIIAGDANIIMERASNGNGRIVLLNSSIASIVIGDPS